jgi:SpoVK/Ycf46/Vps4 family AAA+-type ATPase
MAVCNKCGADIMPGKKFCSDCGTAVNESVSEASTRTIEKILAEFDGMVDMTDIKKAVREIANRIQIQKERDGTKSAVSGNHIVITGNPGTSKTTIVRILGALFKTIGFLKTDTVIEVNGNDLRGSYIGQSKEIVIQKCDEAMGGILFVDEIYTLISGGSDHFGKEAIDTLLRRMEDDRGKFVLIAAGYRKEMDDFLQSNPGFRNRFTHYLVLDDRG